MEERNMEITIIRSKNPEELVVYHASSLEDEIRFYINKTQYISVKEKDEEEIIIGLREEVEEEKTKSKIKLDKKDHLKILLICTIGGVILGAITITALLIGAYFNSMLMYLILLNTMFFAFDIARVVILESKTTPPSLKSKHSAEHMMANFLEKNKRLPKSIDEAKTVSRFSDECGSRHLIKGIAEDFISKMVASIMAVIASTVYLTFFNNAVIDLIIFLAVYFVIEILLMFLLKKCNKFSFLTKPIKKALTIVAQCANTTKKVEDNDIYMAYLAAREWMRIVYPEYYNREEDVFIENISR